MVSCLFRRRRRKICFRLQRPNWELLWSGCGDSFHVGLYFLFRLGFGGGVGGADGFFPCAHVFVGQIGFVTDMFLAVEEKLSEIGEVFGAAGGDAAVGDEIEEFAEDVVDVGGGAELAGDGFEFLADFFLGEELLLFAGVDEAEGGVGLVTNMRHWRPSEKENWQSWVGSTAFLVRDCLVESILEAPECYEICEARKKR